MPSRLSYAWYWAVAALVAEEKLLVILYGLDSWTTLRLQLQ